MEEFSGHRPTSAIIDLDNLAHNLNSVRVFVDKPLKYMAVVKADAYGHGAVECSKRLEAEGIDWFGVALPEEGVQLRQAGIRKLILCLGGFWSGQEELILNFNLTPVIFQVDRAELLNRTAKERGTVASIHVKIDTGMGRIGVRHDAVSEFATALKRFQNLRVEGMMTHLAAADDLSQNEFTDLQVARFHSAVATFRENGHNPAYLDIANSPGTIAHPNALGNMVRLGGVLYGLGGDVLPKGIEKPELRPVLSLVTRVALIKEVHAGETLGYGRTFTAPDRMRVATLPIGYQDGFSRVLSNKGRVIIRGEYAPVVGRVSMDWTMVDVTSIDGASENDEVTVIGANGSRRILAEDIAAMTDSISYEITCGIDRRVPRLFR